MSLSWQGTLGRRALPRHLFGRDPGVRASYGFGYARLWSILLVAVLTGLAVVGGFILLVIPGFVVLVRLICAVPVVVVEGARGRAALSRSWGLVKGDGWRVFGIVVVTWLLAGIVASALTVPFRGSWFAEGLAASVGSSVTTPFVTLMIVLVYFDLRVRKEELDLGTLERELQASTP